ncbi:uncharacterized protein N7479_002203 [Penicillium vulpinum]|uniref:Serine hydrolase domain-containing protein n=1 Tax=Penicillium vulpinum TaxID=29845 RepID=A0A1V6S7P6_9EURO|nr:uncharacterized protein N7479_002203 [Penicillium vulpinum]KAJ5972285.1 hypothetical protein N7479_002203 [Penicillium vulpinum]OQE09878.1 hypothetical protein PENVUL_c005G01338 [Penicillium vulpinum]
MRVLALHGVGSSGAMLKKQLNPLAVQLGQTYQFTFFDGVVSCNREPGMPEWFPGPFYSYVTGYSPVEMQEVLEDLDSFIEENGPFDGVLGFSQGTSIATAYIIDRQTREPNLPAAFSFAVLISSVAACSADPTCLESVIRSLVEHSPFAFKTDFPRCDFELVGPTERVFAEYLALVHLAIKAIGIKKPTIELDFLKTLDVDSVPRLFHPKLVKDRISIPTVHVTGRKDELSMVHQSRIVQGLCDESLLRAHRHQGGHSLPLKANEIKDLAVSIEWAAERGRDRTALHRAGFKI